MRRMFRLLPFALTALRGLTAPANAEELNVGDPAPEFSLPGTDGHTHTLSGLRGRTVVLAWFPGAFTGGCTAECKSLRESGEDIRAFDAAYFMISVDTPEQNKAFAGHEQADFPMLSDPTGATAAAYGVLGPMGLARRWTFYIGPSGRIRAIDKTISTGTAGHDLATKLKELRDTQQD